MGPGILLEPGTEGRDGPGLGRTWDPRKSWPDDRPAVDGIDHSSQPAVAPLPSRMRAVVAWLPTAWCWARPKCSAKLCGAAARQSTLWPMAAPPQQAPAIDTRCPPPTETTDNPRRLRRRARLCGLGESLHPRQRLAAILFWGRRLRPLRSGRESRMATSALSPPGKKPRRGGAADALIAAAVITATPAMPRRLLIGLPLGPSFQRTSILLHKTCRNR